VETLFAGDRRFCTASVVHSPYRNLIVTAAHCLDGSAEDLEFVPGYRDGRAPYGVCKVGRRFLPDGWAKGQDEDSDVAFAVVADRGDGKGVEDVVGGNRFVTGTATGATAVTATGYPNSRETPISCTNKPTAHSRSQQRIECPDFSGGTSGSPWVNGDGEVVGILGGHEEGGATADVSYSVVLGAEAAELYRDAARI
jgi:V8-like Glu-specific endopeptidase